jgi:hypothetical protein
MSETITRCFGNAAEPHELTSSTRDALIFPFAERCVPGTLQFSGDKSCLGSWCGRSLLLHEREILAVFARLIS